MNVAATSVTKKDAQAARTPSPANGTVQPPGTAPTQAGHPLGAAPPGRAGGTRRGPAPTTTVAPRGALPSAHPGRLGPMPTGAGRPQVAHRPAAGPTGPARAAHGARAAAQAAAQPGGLRRAGAQRQAAAAPAVPPRPSGQPHQPAQPPRRAGCRRALYRAAATVGGASPRLARRARPPSAHRDDLRPHAGQGRKGSSGSATGTRAHSDIGGVDRGLVGGAIRRDAGVGVRSTRRSVHRPACGLA